MDLLQELEEIPASYPATPSGLSIAAQAVDPDMIWQRIEAYTRTRYSARGVVWIVTGAGEWQAPLSPATVSTVEQWQGDQWETCTPDASPLGGYDLPTYGPYRITASIGGGDVPAAVSEAFRRLAEYLGDTDDRAGLSSYSVNMGGAIQESYQRNPAWIARAMQNSGAADLLRPYRRQK